MRHLVSFLCLVAFAIVLLPLLAVRVGADPGVTVLYHYGIGDGMLGRPTAFAESWLRPSWVPDRVRWDWPGIALADLSPGTQVRSRWWAYRPGRRAGLS